MSLTTEKIGIVLMGAISVTQNKDPHWWVGTIIVVLAAYSLRIMGDIKNKNFTWASAGIQFTIMVALCSVGFYLWKDAAFVRGFFLFFNSFQVYIFLVAYFSFIIASIGEKIDANGIVNAGSFFKAVKAALAADKTPPPPPIENQPKN